MGISPSYRDKTVLPALLSDYLFLFILKAPAANLIRITRINQKYALFSIPAFSNTHRAAALMAHPNDVMRPLQTCGLRQRNGMSQKNTTYWHKTQSQSQHTSICYNSVITFCIISQIS